VFFRSLRSRAHSSRKLMNRGPLTYIKIMSRNWLRSGHATISWRRRERVSCGMLKESTTLKIKILMLSGRTSYIHGIITLHKVLYE